MDLAVRQALERYKAALNGYESAVAPYFDGVVFDQLAATWVAEAMATVRAMEAQYHEALETAGFAAPNKG